MLIVTTNDLPGYQVTEVFGEVFGLTVRSYNIASQIGAAFKSLAGGELKGLTKNLVDSRREAIARMVTEAEAKGANAVLARRFGPPRWATSGPRSPTAPPSRSKSSDRPGVLDYQRAGRPRRSGRHPQRAASAIESWTAAEVTAQARVEDGSRTPATVRGSRSRRFSSSASGYLSWSGWVGSAGSRERCGGLDQQHGLRRTDSTHRALEAELTFHRTALDLRS